MVPDEILGYLLESGFADPRFNLATGSSREKILKRMSLKQRLSPKSSVLIFRLPKILTTYQLNQEELILLTGFQLSSEDWFFLHNSLRKIIWEKIGKYQDEENMFFRRLNPKKQHHPTDYCYVWEV